MCVMKNKKAEFGMGTLIIFIAMILSAAVAASVLIATTGKLQNKALDTGKLTTNEVGTGFQAIELYGEEGSDQTLEYWYLTIKLNHGSEAVRFMDLLLSFGTSRDVTDYRYNSAIDCSNTASFADYTQGYGIFYKLNGTQHKAGYLNKGDIVKVCFAPQTAITEGERIKLQIIPKGGSNMLIETTAPDMISQYRVKVFP